VSCSVHSEYLAYSTCFGSGFLKQKFDQNKNLWEKSSSQDRDPCSYEMQFGY